MFKWIAILIRFDPFSFDACVNATRRGISIFVVRDWDHDPVYLLLERGIIMKLEDIDSVDDSKYSEI